MNADTIRLRQVTPNDNQFILALTTDKDWLLNIGDRGVHDPASAKQFIQESLLPNYQTDGLGLMGIEHIQTGELMGLCGLLQRDYFEYPDLGFALLPEYRGCGYVNMAAQQVLVNPLAQSARMILASTVTGNKASQNTLQKLGFRKPW